MEKTSTTATNSTDVIEPGFSPKPQPRQPEFRPYGGEGSPKPPPISPSPSPSPSGRASQSDFR